MRPFVIHEFRKFLAWEVVAEAAKLNIFAYCALSELASLYATKAVAQATITITCPTCTAIEPTWTIVRWFHLDIPSLSSSYIYWKPTKLWIPSRCQLLSLLRSHLAHKSSFRPETTSATFLEVMQQPGGMVLDGTIGPESATTTPPSRLQRGNSCLIGGQSLDLTRMVSHIPLSAPHVVGDWSGIRHPQYGPDPQPVMCCAYSGGG